MNALPQPFTALSIRARCECCDDVTIIGYREGALYGLLARYDFPDAELPEVLWLTKDGRYSKDGGPSVYDLQVVR
jgi:hypothetical protein